MESLNKFGRATLSIKENQLGNLWWLRQKISIFESGVRWARLNKNWTLDAWRKFIFC